MANPEHVMIAWRGIETIRSWFARNPGQQFDLSHANLSDIKLTRAALPGTNLRGALLTAADLRGANLQSCDLTGCTMLGATLSGADLSKAILRRAGIESTDLVQTDLRGLDLRDACLEVVDLAWADLDGADLTNVTLGDVNLAGVYNLPGALGLDAVHHLTPSFIDLATILESRGQIPEIFLRGCGVPAALIEFLPLMADALNFYSCFISFTEVDDLFSTKLYKDLQSAGVRCWRWKEDAKWGKTLMRSVDEAVREYDKLIVVCSEDALKSPAVLREIERALQKEDDLCRQGKNIEVLFPIRLDDFIFDCWEHPRKADAICKHVGDFRNWKEPASYKKALDRLIGDLQAEKPPPDEG